MCAVNAELRETFRGAWLADLLTAAKQMKTKVKKKTLEKETFHQSLFKNGQLQRF
jgi:hypothetical protein